MLMSFQKEIHAVQFGLRPGLGWFSFCRGKGAKIGGDPGQSPHVHPHCPQLRGYDLETDTLHLTASRLRVGDRGSVWSVVLVLPPLHLKGQSRHAKGQSGFQPFPLSFYIKLLGTSESRSSGATFCFSCLSVSHLIFISQLCNGTAGLQEMPKRRPWALSSRISLHPC